MHYRTSFTPLRLALSLVALVVLLPGTALASSGKAFKTPREAADAFVIAVAARQEGAMEEILGTDWRDYIPTDEIDQEDLDRFLDAWIESHGILFPAFDKALLAVGSEDWTLPIPIVLVEEGWQFDMEAGHEEILLRQIGRNELAAIESCLAYFDAQKEYALADRDDDGVLSYARKLISTPGQKDGLYWAALPDEEPSPLGPFFGSDEPGDNYHGYHYRILQGQGEEAPGGAYSYLIGERMVAGFALVAWPAVYEETGLMSFLVSHDGALYQKDLGPESDRIAREMTLFEPGEGWATVSHETDSRY